MSREVEERVVQMSFENGQFEKAAKESMQTVDELKKKTDFRQTAKAIVSSGMTEAVQKVSSAFTSLGGIIKRKVFEQLADDIINGSRKLFNELEIEPIQQGFNEYELKMGSVQTIMASTGETLAVVDGYLEELNTYADRTIYSFSDMTNNIGKFTNAGVKLEDAVAAIQGISNEAALSGANANEASRAMYNFAQALSSGVVRLIDWKSIENANMATVEFKNELIKTAEELGTIKKTSNGMWVSTVKGGKNAFNATSAFNDALQDQWLTSDVLIKTLARYSDETTDLGKRAYAAAQDVKTFSQLMDTLKEASGSGWAQTWQIIFGNFEEAKELWTGVNNVISAMIDNQADSRNAMLQQWKDLGGRTLLIQGLADAFYVLKGFVDAAIEGFKEFFPSLTGNKLFDWTKNFRVFIGNLRAALPYVYEYGEQITGTGDQVYKTNRKYFKFTGVLEKVYRIFNGLGAVFSIVAKGLSTIAGLFFDLVKWGVSASEEGLLGWLAGIGDRLGEIRDDMNQTDFFGRWRQKFIDAVVPTQDKLRALSDKLSEFFGSIRTWFAESGIQDKITSSLKAFGEDFIAAVPLVITGITDFISGVIDFIKTNEKVQSFIKKIQNLINDIVDAAPVLYQDVVNFVKGLFGFGEESDTLAARFVNLTNSIAGFIAELMGYDENGASAVDRWLKDFFPSMGEAAKESEDTVTNPILALVDKIKLVMGDLKGAFITIGTTIGEAIEWTFSKMEEYDIEGKLGKIFAFWAGSKFVGLIGSFTKLNKALAGGIGGFGSIFEAVVANLNKTGDGAKGVFDSIAGVFSKFWENMTGMSKDWTDIFRKKDTPATALLKAAGAIGILVAAVYLLSKFDTESFLAGAEKLGILAVGLLIFTGIFNQMSRGFTIKDVGSQIAKMAVGIIVLIAAIGIMGHMKLETLLQGIIFLGAVLTELAIFLQLSKGGGFAKDSSTRFISLAVSLIIITQVLKQLGNMNFGDIVTSLIGLGAILFELSIFVKTTKLEKGQSLAGFFGLALSLLSIINVIKTISRMDPAKFLGGLVGLGAILLELGIFSRLASKEFSFGSGIAFTGLAISLLVFVRAMKDIAEMKVSDIAKALVVVTILLTEFTVVSKFMGNGMGLLNSIGLLIAIAGSIAVFFEVLYLLKDYPASQMLSIGVSFGTMLAGLAAIILVVSKIPPHGIAQAVANIGIIAGVIIALGTALNAINELSGGLAAKALRGSADMLALLGEAIGGFFGGLVGGAAAVFTSQLPSIGKSLADFMTNAAPFFEGCGKLNQNTLVGMAAVILGIGAITEIEFLNGISRFLNFNQSSMQVFAEDVKLLGGALVGFSESVEGIKNSDKMTEAATAAKALADMNNSLPPTDGRLQEWLGTKDLALFSSNMIRLGVALKWFSINLREGKVDDKAITRAGNAAQVIADLNNMLPPTDGALQFWVGEKNLGTFAANLGPLGEGIAAMSLALHDVEQSDVDKATTAARILGSFAGSLPDVSIFDLFGKNQYTDFVTNIPSVGTAIGNFALNLAGTGVTYSKLTNALTAAGVLTEFVRALSIPEIDYLIQSDLITFGNGIARLGTGLHVFDINTRDLDQGSVTNATTAAGVIAEFAQTDLKGRTLKEIIGQWLTGETELQAFSDGMSNFGTGLNSLYTSIKDIKDWTGVTTAVDNMQKIADVVEQLSTVGWTNFEFSGDAFSSWDSNGLKEFLTGLSDLGTAPYEAGKTFADGAKEGCIEGLKSLPDVFKESTLNAGTEMINAASKLSYAMYQMGINIGVNTLNGFYYNDFYGAGQDAANGFIGGIVSRFSVAYRAGANLGSWALAGTRDMIQSASPSKEFAKLGSYSGEGFVNGIDKWDNRTVSAGERLGKSALEGAKSTMAYLYSIINSSMDLQPVIRPVIDTTDVAFGAAQIGNILATNAVPMRGFSASSVPSVANLGGFDNAEILARSNNGVIEAVNGLGKRIDNLGNQIANLKMVADTGVLAGQMREHIDTELGVMAFRKGRRN